MSFRFRITTNGKMFRIEANPSGTGWVKFENTVYGDLKAARNAKERFELRASQEIWKPVDGEPVE